MQLPLTNMSQLPRQEVQNGFLRTSSMGISKITTRNRHYSSNNFTNHDDKTGYNSTIEIDIHSGTHFSVRTNEFCHQQNKHSQLLHSLIS